MNALALSLALLLTGTALASDPKVLVESKYAEIKAIVATDKTDAGVQQKVTAVLESFTDFTEFSRQTMKGSWEKLNDKQRTLFTERYRLLLHKSYIKHFKAGQPLEVGFRGDVEVVEDKALVPTTVKSGDTEAEVDYKLVKKPAGFMVYDLVIDEVSLMRSYRKQFNAIFEKDGFDALIKKIDERIAKNDTKVD
ncbi:MAG: ABC transporter substrate-binding protein [Myxococcales bacterium]|nr:ABC transporter substrate-binding protein [Myxococcales bacterium]